MYLIYNNDNTKHGIRAFSECDGIVTVQTKGELPENGSGFKVYDEDETLLADFSEYATKYNRSDIGAAVMYSRDGSREDENAPLDVYYDNPDPEEMMKRVVEGLKLSKIAESKAGLAEWLEANPMLYTDGRLYSVTEEKQSLLNSNLASYERAKAAGIEYPLKWNSTGDECVPWEYADLTALSLEIAAYVAPKVSKQQELELAIKACETAEELDGIVISYD